MTNWQQVAADLTQAGLTVIQDPSQRHKLSGDYYHFSPILTPQLQDKRADLVVVPHSEADVIQVARFCVAAKIPLTVRGAGTGNYGQSVPLAGGIVLDLSAMQRILSLEPGRCVVEPGVKLAKLDRQAHQIGWELRMAPSTYHTATVGGFVGGGSAGMGSVTYGLLAEPGNVQAVRLVTMEPDPQVITLSGSETLAALHAYGTNGIITQLTLPLAPALPWAEAIASFGTLEAAIAFGQELGACGGIVKKEIAVFAAPIPSYFGALKAYYQPDRHWVMVMVAAGDWDAFAELVQARQGEILAHAFPHSDDKKLNLLEFTWNHTTLLARAVDPHLTYLQTLYRDLDQVLALQDLFGDEVMTHIEMMRVQGEMRLGGIPLIRFTSGDRLQEIITIHQEMGVSIANPHVYTIEAGSSHPLPPSQLALKQRVDPLGLLNPGKMASFRRSPSLSEYSE